MCIVVLRRRSRQAASTTSGLRGRRVVHYGSPDRGKEGRVGGARDVGERWFATVTLEDPAAIEALLAPSCDFSAPGAALSTAREAGTPTHRAYWDNVAFFGQLGLMPEQAVR
jgi:hypothetical protein